MFYTDTFFLLLFAAVWAITLALRPWPAVKEWFLVGFSFFVIASWGYYDLGLFLATLAVNYVAAGLLARRAPGRSHGLLAAIIALDLGTLAFFKYANFIGGTLGALIGHALPVFPLGIPLAISFYIFHLISYLVDVHAGRVRLASFRGYVFYLSFFPHVIAGPIVRAWQLVPQIGAHRRRPLDFSIGIHFFVTGFFLKSVLANNIAGFGNTVVANDYPGGIDAIWSNLASPSLSTADHWAVAFLYYCQIYGDFAGYSLMALGMARLLGYRLPANFRSPMRAATFQEFWQRWHITLSHWLRDYLYIPLGGGRGTLARVMANTFITMLLGGLWHGAAWGFVIWGGMHGLGLVVERLLGLRRLTPHSPAWRGWWAVTQIWVTMTWVFFRAPTLHEAAAFLHGMFTFSPRPWHLEAPVRALWLCALAIVLHQVAPRYIWKMGRRRLPVALGIATGLMAVLNLVVVSPSKVFIYFKF
jgi:alginate O-acetyltransferase complex protein AlgI